MSRARHKRAMGGSTKPAWNAGEEQNAAKEAEERKRGGRTHHMGEGEKTKERHDRPARAKGGAVPGRKRGGGVGANLTPLSTAAKVKHVTKDETDESGIPSD